MLKGSKLLTFIPLLIITLLFAPICAAAPNVEIFVASKCPHCDLVVDHLRAKGLPVSVWNLEDDPYAERDYLETVGRGIIPVVRIGSEIRRGKDLTEIDEMVRASFAERASVTAEHQIVFEKNGSRIAVLEIADKSEELRFGTVSTNQKQLNPPGTLLSLFLVKDPYQTIRCGSDGRIALPKNPHLISLKEISGRVQADPVSFLFVYPTTLTLLREARLASGRLRQDFFFLDTNENKVVSAAVTNCQTINWGKATDSKYPPSIIENFVGPIGSIAITQFPRRVLTLSTEAWAYNESETIAFHISFLEENVMSEDDVRLLAATSADDLANHTSEQAASAFNRLVRSVGSGYYVENFHKTRQLIFENLNPSIAAVLKSSRYPELSSNQPISSYRSTALASKQSQSIATTNPNPQTNSAQPTPSQIKHRKKMSTEEFYSWLAIVLIIWLGFVALGVTGTFVVFYDGIDLANSFFGTALPIVGLCILHSVTEQNNLPLQIAGWLLCGIGGILLLNNFILSVRYNRSFIVGSIIGVFKLTLFWGALLFIHGTGTSSSKADDRRFFRMIISLVV